MSAGPSQALELWVSLVQSPLLVAQYPHPTPPKISVISWEGDVFRATPASGLLFFCFIPALRVRHPSTYTKYL